jgi:hypothetical protein
MGERLNIALDGKDREVAVLIQEMAKQKAEHADQ